MADFANGKLNYSGTNLGSTFTQSYPRYGALHFRIPALNFYVSDEWAVTRDFKVTFGIRFEKDLNPSCNENCFVLTNVPFVSPVIRGAPAFLQFHDHHQVKPVLQRGEHHSAAARRDCLEAIRRRQNRDSRRRWLVFDQLHGRPGRYARQPDSQQVRSGRSERRQYWAGNRRHQFAYLAQQSANAFFSGFAAGYTLAQIKAVVPTFSTPSITSVPSTYSAPKDIEWNIELERQLSAHDLFSVNYVGNHGYNLAETLNANMYTAASA